jgi:copper(I)-binding protein
MKPRASALALVFACCISPALAQAPAATTTTTTTATTTTTTATTALVVSEAWVRQPAPGAKHVAGFLRLHNSTGDDVEVVGAGSSLSPRTELHTHLHQGGIMKMRQVPSIVVKAHSDVVLQPGGLHVMFMDVARHPAPGDIVELTLKLKDGRAMTVKVPVLTTAPTTPTTTTVPAAPR